MSNSQKSLAIVGYSASGKSTLASYLAKSTNSIPIEIGKYVIADAQKCIFCKNPLEHANHIFEAKNYLYFVRKAIAEAKRYKDSVIFVGPRLIEELNLIKSFYNQTVTVALKVDIKTRIGRFLGNNNIDTRINNCVWLYCRDKIEASWGLDWTILQCDLIFNGNKNISELLALVERHWLCSDNKKVL